MGPLFALLAAGSVWRAWVARLYGAGGSIKDAYGVAVNSAGDVFTSGFASTSDSAIIAKYNKTGLLLWQRSIASAGEAWGIALDTSGNPHIGTDNGYTIKLAAADGAITWQRRLTGSVKLQGIGVDSSGNVHVAGYMVGSPDVGVVARYSSAGAIQWQRKLSSTNATEFRGVAVDVSGNVHVVGTYTNTINDIVLAKYNSSGTIQWQRKLTATAGGSGSPLGWSIAVDSGGNVYIGGANRDGSVGTYAMAAKYNSAGAIQWQRHVSPNATGLALVRGIAVDGSGAVFVVGKTSAHLGRIVKLDSSGVAQFMRSLSVAGGAVTLSGMVLDETSGYMLIPGTFDDGGASTDILTARLPLDGTGQGSFALNGINLTYSGLSDGSANAGMTAATATLTDAAGTATDAASSLTGAAGSLTNYTNGV